MARLLKLLDPALSHYRDRRFPGTQEQFEQRLQESTTLYIGNLSFYTTEEQIYEVFSRCGDVQRIIMGLDKNKKTPCGFCFVVYYTRLDAEDAVKYLSGTRVDERPIRVDFDWGFVEGRQFGRGRGGGQVRDEYRVDYDEGRGGYGNIVKAQLSQRQKDMLHQMKEYEAGQGDADEDGGGAERETPAAGAANPRFREDNSDEE